MEQGTNINSKPKMAASVGRNSSLEKTLTTDFVISLAICIEEFL